MEQLIKLMSDGEFHTGDELGDVLKISRSAIWKQIQRLISIGADVQAVRGKGYRLAKPMELLDASLINSQLDPLVLPCLKTIEIVLQTNSTNALAMSRASSGCGSGYICLAEQQSEGRGRRGRKWQSPIGANIYLSCVWEFFDGAAALEGITLAVGVVIGELLEQAGVKGVSLKWPNDVLIDEAKVGGVLLEMTGDPSGHCQVIIGIGVNHGMPLSIAANIDQAWTSVELHSPDLTRNLLASRLISGLVAMLTEFQSNGFEPFRARWRRLDGFRGRQVVIRTGAAEVEGLADGIDDTGGLRLVTPSGLEIYKGGEVSVRPKS